MTDYREQLDPVSKAAHLALLNRVDEMGKNVEQLGISLVDAMLRAQRYNDDRKRKSRLGWLFRLLRLV
jgi:hypothetical protein